MNQEIKEKIFRIFKNETHMDPTTIDPDTDLLAQITFDSLQLIGIIAKIEDELNIELPLMSMEINTLNEFFEIVSKEL